MPGGVEQRRIDDRTLTALLPLDERRQDGRGGAPAAEQVGGRQRRHAAGGRQEPRQGLVAKIVAGPGAVRTGLSPAGDRADHQAGMAAPQGVGRGAHQPLQAAGPEALEKDVGRRQEPLEDLPAAVAPEV